MYRECFHFSIMKYNHGMVKRKTVRSEWYTMSNQHTQITEITYENAYHCLSCSDIQTFKIKKKSNIKHLKGTIW